VDAAANKTTPVLLINFRHHQQHRQLHVHKAEEQNVRNKQENTLHRTFSYLQIPTET